MTQLSPKESRICDAVMRHITQRRLARDRAKTGVYGFFLICAVLALGPAVELLVVRAASSGFSAYVSLIISDGSHLSGSWNALALSLVESAPLAGFILTLCVLIAAAYCAREFSVSRQLLHYSII